MAYVVHITARALREIDEALAWLGKYSTAAAQRWYDRLMEAVDSLATNPEQWPLAPASERYPGELRQRLHGKRRQVYRILFEVRGHTVYILRVRHSAQDLLESDEL